MPRIFISYRHDDSPGFVRSLYEHLQRQFTAKHVLLDVEALKDSSNFVAAITERLADVDILLMVVGPRWMRRLPDGRSSLESDTDFVRLEVHTALDKQIAVIPVLVDGGKMPALSELPASLQDVGRQLAVEVTHAKWNDDLKTLDERIRRTPVKPRWDWRTIGPIIGLVFCVLGAAFSAWMLHRVRERDEWNSMLSTCRQVSLANLGVGTIGKTHRITSNQAQTCLTACDRGDASSCNTAAWLYLDGLGGLPKDTSRAIALEDRACLNLNNGVVCSFIANSYDRGKPHRPKDDGNAKKYRQLACEFGHLDSCDILKGIPTSPTR